METIAAVLDVVFSLCAVPGAALLAYGGWLAFTGGQAFPQEGKGRYAWRHQHRARQIQRALPNSRFGRP